MTRATYRITCFMKQEPSQLFPLLLPLHFKWEKRNSIIWEREGTSFQLIPFSTKGSESMGYRILYVGNPDTFVYLVDQFLGSFTPVFSGIEWIYESGVSQDGLVSIAEREQFTRCSMYGLYEHKKIGVVLQKTGEINLQIRNRNITSHNMASYMYGIESIASYFLPKEPDLFSLLDEVLQVS